MSNFPFEINPELDLVLERTLDVSAEKIFAAWTDPESLKKWFVPRPWSLAECEVDARPGGIFRSVMQSPEGEKFDNPGSFLYVEPNKLLIFTSALGPGFRPIPSEMPFTAVLDLEPLADGKTKYTAIAIHSNPEDAKKHDEMGFQTGWGTVVDQLEEVLKAEG